VQVPLGFPVREDGCSRQQGFDKIRDSTTGRVLLTRVQMDAVRLAGRAALVNEVRGTLPQVFESP
jgi:hypothetical protein